MELKPYRTLNSQLGGIVNIPVEIPVMIDVTYRVTYRFQKLCLKKVLKYFQLNGMNSNEEHRA